MVLAAALWSPPDVGHDDVVLVVATPGFAREAYLPLIEELRQDGYAVRLFEAGCAGQDASAIEDALVASAAELEPGYQVVAHGLGALLAMRAAPRLQARRYALLAPTLDVWPVEALTWLGERPAPLSIDLGVPATWHGFDLALTLLGDTPPPLTCVPAPLAAEVQSWIRAGHVPVNLAAVEAPVWIGVSLGDDVAALEAVIPASRALPHRKIVRLGVGRLDRQDFDHAELLSHKVPLRVLRRWLRRRSWRIRPRSTDA